MDNDHGNEVESYKKRMVIANVDNTANDNNNKGLQNFVSFGKNIYPQQIIIPSNKKLHCCELIESLLSQGLSFLSFSVALYYYNKNYNQKKLDTRVLLAELLTEINCDNNDNNNKRIEENEILLKFVKVNGLVNFQFFRLMNKSQKHEDEFVEFIVENKLEISTNTRHYMENLFIQNVNSLCNQDVALLIFIELHMMNVFDDSNNILCNMYLEVIDKIKNTMLLYSDLFSDEENTLSFLGYSSSIEVSKKQMLNYIIQQFYQIINNH